MALTARGLRACTAFCLALTASLTLNAQTIRIGQSADQTGPVAGITKELNSGIMLYLDTVNRNGGVHGQKIEFVTLDDGYKPEQAKANVDKLIKDSRVVGLLGILGTGVNIAVSPQVEAAGIPLVGPLSGSPEFQQLAGPHTYHVRASYGDEVRAMIRHLTSSGITRIATVYMDNAFGKSALKHFEAAMADKQLSPTAMVPIGGPDFKGDAPVAALLKAEPGAVILLTAGKASVNFLKTAMDQNLRPLFLGLSVISASEMQAAIGKDVRGMVVAQVVPSPASGKFAIVREFQKAGSDAGTPLNSHLALEGFIAAKVMVEGLRRSPAPVTRQSLQDALSGISRVDLGGYNIVFSATSRLGSHFVDLSMVRADGSYAQ
jgi:branched-chain amino acid transport system substrate-binding protein